MAIFKEALTANNVLNGLQWCWSGAAQGQRLEACTLSEPEAMYNLLLSATTILVT